MSAASERDPAERLFIYPDVRHPYYIVSPPYVRTSAGIRSLHLLCHSLNRLGHVAYMVQAPVIRADPAGPDLLTPFLSQSIAQDHFERGLTPIVVYPETIIGNPVRAPCVIRYVCNFPGLLGGDTEYHTDELCFSYSETLAAHTPAPDNVLFVPATDTRIFKPPTRPQVRTGSCFYADKYRNVHGGKPSPVTRNSIEITRDRPDSPTPQQIAALFQRSEVFYCYENTALAIEAVLCGCPAVFLPNPHLTEIIAAQELGSDGYAWGTDPDEIARATATVGQGARNYLRTFEKFWHDLDRFVQLTQAHVEGKAFVAPVHVPTPPRAPMVDRVAQAWRHHGTVWVARKVAQKVAAKARRRMRAPRGVLGSSADNGFPEYRP